MHIKMASLYSPQLVAELEHRRKVREQMEQEKLQRVIIAMKGHPGSGKSTLANALASALRIPLLDKDDVRDCTAALQHRHSTQPSLLNDLSYAVLWRLAATQLRLGLSLVVDSPLSRRAHLDHLLHLASSFRARLVVVECRPRDRDEWRRRLERRGATGDSWHKPSTWEDLEKLLEGYGGCTEYDVGDVARIEVDTTADAEIEDMVSDVVEFILCHARVKCG